MIRINPNLYPPDGYRFKELDGSIHRADGWKNLVKVVTSYREVNNLPVGDVMAEIMGQVCAEVPGFCNDDTPRPVYPKSGSMSYNQRILAFMGNALSKKRMGRWPLIEDGEAARRASICAVCPMQKSLNRACQACISDVERGERVLLDGKKPRHQNLQTCALLFENTVCTVQADIEPSDNPDLPPNCWRAKRA